MKIRATIEMEVGQVSKYSIDNLLAEAFSNVDIRGVKVVGPYTDANGMAISDDFFVSDENFAKTAESILLEENLDKERVSEFIKGEKVLELHREWNEYVMNNESFNTGGKEKFKELALHIFNKAS